MRVQYANDKKKGGPEEAELYKIGRCLALVVGKVTHRILLSPSQWKLLADSASEAANEENW